MCRSVAVLALLNALSAHGHEVVEVHGAGVTRMCMLRAMRLPSACG